MVPYTAKLALQHPESVRPFQLCQGIKEGERGPEPIFSGRLLKKLAPHLESCSF